MEYSYVHDEADGPNAIAAATDVSDRPVPSKPRQRPTSRINPVFLRNIVSHAEDHNANLLKREREEKLGLRRHPLVHKIRKIEQEKLARGQRDRQSRISKRSFMTTREHNRNCDARDTNATEQVPVSHRTISTDDLSSEKN